MSNTLRAEKLAERIETARTTSGITLLSLSDTSGVAYSTLRRKLRSPDLFTVRELSALADALDAQLTIGFAA